MNESLLEPQVLSPQAPTGFVFFSGPKKAADIRQVYNTQDILSCPEKRFSCFDYIPRFRATLFKPLISPEVFLAGINNARIATARYVVVADGNQIIADTIPRTLRMKLRKPGPLPATLSLRVIPAIGRSLAGNCVARIEGVSALLGEANYNYGHWHMDVLSSFGLLQELKIDKKVTLLTSELKSYRRRSLELLGVDFNRVREVPGNTLVGQHVFCDRLIFPSPLSVNYGHVPFWQQHIFDRILKNVLLENGNGQGRFAKRVYIDRTNDIKRRCLNEPELVQRLRELGFKIIVPGNLTYDEQVLTFANADTIVGCMGAGLVNVIFARPGASLIELKPPRHHVTDLWKTYAALAGVNHHSILVPNDGSRTEDDTWRIPDIDAAVEDIRHML
jgi:hypothetical protein